MVRLAIDLQETAQWGAKFLYLITIITLFLGIYLHPGYIVLFVIFGILSGFNFYLKNIQTKHALLRNFGILATVRYFMESIGPEMRQYFYLSDTEERPFNRTERADVYRKSKNIDSTESFGTQLDIDKGATMLRHSMFPLSKKDVEEFSLTFGDERKLKSQFTINKAIMISAMSFGSLGANAVMALSLGAHKAGIPINTGEGGLSTYHLSGGADVIYQMGTAKFGCRNNDGTLNEEKFQKIAQTHQVKMVEIKFSQGAKPGKGGLLPKEKITEEIAKIRHVGMDKDVVSPSRHMECDNPKNTVKFIKKIQDLSELPVGIKFCLGDIKEFSVLIKEMKKQKVFPDYIAVDGAEGATGAAPKSFMDNVGVPLFASLKQVCNVLEKEKVRNKLKVVASGKLINPGKQIAALATGADAIYTARGFLLSLGCIQALQCNKGTCPAGITTHDPVLQRGLDVEAKSERVYNYVKNSNYEFKELLSALGVKNASKLGIQHLYHS